jgi:hypothetical protein
LSRGDRFVTTDRAKLPAPLANSAGETSVATLAPPPIATKRSAPAAIRSRHGRAAGPPSQPAHHERPAPRASRNSAKRARIRTSESGAGPGRFSWRQRRPSSAKAAATPPPTEVNARPSSRFANTSGKSSRSATGCSRLMFLRRRIHRTRAPFGRSMAGRTNPPGRVSMIEALPSLAFAAARAASAPAAVVVRIT